MRLINSKTMEFKEFVGRNIPDYAILSHTWEEDQEVLFEEMSNSSRYAKKGWQKIVMTCQKACEAGLEYVWVDTCCINKSSSAELSEAINSMYRWYERSKICYAFLSDLPTSTLPNTALRHCRWFTRGWTLQELIAPEELHFFDQSWNYVGKKKELLSQLSTITGVSEDVLYSRRNLMITPVAQKMSWAAQRTTTRTEDIAYSLLGIFNINMALLYGEEERAFQRLQEEIIKSTSDMSIFAWTMPSGEKLPGRPDRFYSGLLAKSPLHFANCKSFRMTPWNVAHELSITNIGIKTSPRVLVEVPISDKRPWKYSFDILPVDCFSLEAGGKTLGVKLKLCGVDRFLRADPWTLYERTSRVDRCIRRDIYLLPDMQLYYDRPIVNHEWLAHNFRRNILKLVIPPDIACRSTWPRGCFDYEDDVILLSGDRSNFMAVQLKLDHECEVSGPKNARGECFFMFWAIGCSLIYTEPQCTLIHCCSFSAQLQEIMSELVNKERSGFEVADEAAGLLKSYGIPRSSAVAFKMRGTDESAFLSFVTAPQTDTEISFYPFCKVTFSLKVHKTEKLPQIEYGNWLVKSKIRP